MMFKAVSSLLLLSLFSVGYGQTPAVIRVSNGGGWGYWADYQSCPEGYYAKGFDLKVERYQWLGDDTSLNGIRLHCARNDTSATRYLITSNVERWGSWTSTVSCHKGFLIAFSLRVETPRVLGDNTAANNIMFRCSDQSVIKGSGHSWGSYGPWSESCEIGICGISTKVEGYKGKGDDTALNDVLFKCCRN